MYSEDDDRPTNSVGSPVNRAAVTGKHLSSSQIRFFVLFPVTEQKQNIRGHASFHNTANCPIIDWPT